MFDADSSTGALAQFHLPEILPTVPDILFGFLVAAVVGLAVFQAAKHSFAKGVTEALRTPAESAGRRFSMSADRFDDSAKRFNDYLAVMAAEIAQTMQEIRRDGLRTHVDAGAGPATGGTLPVEQRIEGPYVALPDLERARSLADLGKYEEALVLYQQLFAAHPKLVALPWEMGNLLLHLKQYDSAADALRRAVELEPNHPEFHYSLGLAYFRGANDGKGTEPLQKAAQEFTEAQRKGSQNPQTGVFLGLVRWKLGDFVGAIQCTRHALEKAKVTGEVDWQGRAMNNIAYYLFEQADEKARIGNKDVPDKTPELDEAEQLATGAMELLGKTPRTLDTLGCILLWKGKYKAAADQFSTAFQAKPSLLYSEHYTRAARLGTF